MAARPMNTTWRVGETLIPKRYQSVGRCHSPSPKGSSTMWLSAVCSKIKRPISGCCKRDHHFRKWVSVNSRGKSTPRHPSAAGKGASVLRCSAA